MLFVSLLDAFQGYAGSLLHILPCFLLSTLGRRLIVTDFVKYFGIHTMFFLGTLGEGVPIAGPLNQVVNFVLLRLGKRTIIQL